VSNPTRHPLLGIGRQLLGEADETLATYIRFR